MLLKSDAFGAFRTFKAQAERESGNPILALMIDGGGELLSNKWRTYCQNEAIVIRISQPYSPEMNGIAERGNRILAKHASAMLWDAKLPIGFWAAAVLNASYLKNRSPTNCLDCTPFQAFFGKVRNLGHIRTFGCSAHAHVPLEIRSKTLWDSHSTECILIGHLETENMYELWDIQKGEAIRRRDVVFWEDKLGNDLLMAHALPHGTEILPIAQQYVESVPIIPSQLPVPQAYVPLKQLPSQQSVTSLPSQQPTPAGAVFENWTIDQMKLKYDKEKATPLLKPTLSSTALMMQHTPIGISSSEWATWKDLFFTTDSDADVNCSSDPFSLLSAPNLDDVILSDNDALPRPKIPKPRFSRDASAPSIPRNNYEATKSKDCIGWHTAMKTELKKLTDMNAWILVDLPPGKSAIGNRWVFSLKNSIKQDGRLLQKARLVARGNRQVYGIDYEETYAPIIKLVSLRIMLTIAAIRDLDLKH